ncbi:maleate cis-trans isomerase [Saccharopolyspora lacisalsi]|uniref:Maleate cis-trans isomerase n=2 Tax=Halosaccharopolyspora lacisalsi TaxID=1000566 RepID=A0A839DYV2_9PSEU|nr:maleate cis-trans isomerase [Halosaccharopolyspora lacisalsi]MBA8824667.1 maleate cis-trans isomerase [Halosaccharopolyspora lacisalsi]
MAHTAGMLYPGYSAEDDYPTLEGLLGEGVRLPLVHTLMRHDAHREDALLDVGGSDVLATGARRLLDHGVDSVVWACTSGSFVFGWHGAQQQIRQLRDVTGTASSSTSFAFVHAAASLGLTRVAVAATYPDDIAERFAGFLRTADIEVLSLASRGVVTAAEVGTLGREQVLEFAAAHDHPRAQALLMPDTALHTAAWLDDLEARLGKPVLTANQVSAWEGLRLAGHVETHSGLGALFSRGGHVEVEAVETGTLADSRRW